MTSRKLSTHPIHLGLGATAVAEPAFTGDLAWYDGYMARHAADGADARIVAMHSFNAPWGLWEMHPEGSEVVLCTAGSITLHQEYPDGHVEIVTLGPGSYAMNDPGVWHTADVDGEATAVFITAGKGTEHRPR